MLIAYLKLALRLLVRSPFFTAINVLGLSFGFAAFFILWQHASSELQSDQYHKDFQRIGRIGLYWRWPDAERGWGLLTFGGIRPHQPATIAEDFPAVEQYVRLLMQPEFQSDWLGHGSQVVVSVGRENGGVELFEETRMVYADPNLFDFFTIPLLQGDKQSVLKHAQSVVLSSQTARKYFGAKNPVGEMIQINDSVLLTVTGVFEDLPANTHLAFDLVASTVGIPASQWPRYTITTVYVKLTPQTSFDDFASQVNKNSARYWAWEFNRFPEVRAEMFVQPLSEIAFGPPFERDYLVPKSKSALQLMQFASLLILAMACINYNNLTASRMIKRMKEIATRKMTGALSFDFAKQFLVESSLIHALAAAGAFTFVQLVRLPISELFRIHIKEFSSVGFETWSLFIMVIFLGILMAGLYPTFIATSFNPRSLYSLSTKSRASRWLQGLLSTSQYLMALVLLLWVYIVYLQLNFILNRNLGILTDQVVVVDAPIIKSEKYVTDFDSFIRAMRSIVGVTEATYSATVIGDTDPFFVWVKGPAQPNFTSASSNGGVDESFIPFYRIKLLAGRNFVAGDRPDVVILSSMVTKRIGFTRPVEAVGEIISVNEFDPKPVEVIGVIEDYRVKPLLNLSSTATENDGGIGICLLYKTGIHDWRIPERISLRIAPERLEPALDQVRTLFQRTFSGNIFHWYFLGDHINKVYENDRIARNQISLFTCIAIGLSCLGLLGMMTTITEEKVKEIGVRKVLGAGVGHIVHVLIRSLLWPVVPAVIIAIPVAYFLSDQFLNRYLEKIQLHWWHFAAPVIVLVAILLGTISRMILRAAWANPVEALKHE